MVADPGIGVPLDRSDGQLGQVGPRLQASRVLRRDGGDRLPTAVRREGPGRVESGRQLRCERVEHRLGAAGRELDCVLGGHRAMLRAVLAARTGTVGAAGGSTDGMSDRRRAAVLFGRAEPGPAADELREPPWSARPRARGARPGRRAAAPHPTLGEHGTLAGRDRAHHGPAGGARRPARVATPRGTAAPVRRARRGWSSRRRSHWAAPCPTTSSSGPSTRSRCRWSSTSPRPRRSAAPCSISPTRVRPDACTAPSWRPPSTSSSPRPTRSRERPARRSAWPSGTCGRP